MAAVLTSVSAEGTPHPSDPSPLIERPRGRPCEIYATARQLRGRAAAAQPARRWPCIGWPGLSVGLRRARDIGEPVESDEFLGAR
jgi:hypothetical protein